MDDLFTVPRNLVFGLLLLLRRTAGALVSMLTLAVCMAIYEVPVREAYIALSIISALLALLFFSGGEGDDLKATPGFWTISVSVVSRWILIVGVLLILGYATKTSSIFSRKLLFTWMIITPPLLSVALFLIRGQIARLRLKLNKKKFVVVGANHLGVTISQKIMNNPKFGLTFQGFFDDRNSHRLEDSESLPIRGGLADLIEYVRQNSVDVVFITLPVRNIQRVTDILEGIHDTTVSVYYVPDIFVFDLIQCRADEIDGVPVIALCETPYYGGSAIIKRFSDVAIASTVLLLSLPIFIGISLAIKATSPGPVIFRQRRYGLDGREIIVYKFRTMTVMEDSDVIRQATKDDDRITAIGRILRRYSLDELPQFINVLQGTMSVVGPRPHAVAHNEEYRRLIKGYMIRHKVNPGITGLAQVQGFRGETASVEDMQNRVEADLEYLRNWSLALDFRIIAKTLTVIWDDKMAY